MTSEISTVNPALAVTLTAAVPLWIAEFRNLSPDERIRIAAEASRVVASQGDTLQYGSGYKFGHGTRQLQQHLARAPRGEKCPDPDCWCNRTGQPSFSAGEVFNELAKGLACAAYQPGGITFAGLHWCVDHAACEEAARAAEEATRAAKEAPAAAQEADTNEAAA